MTEQVHADELRITVEMGDDYQPSDRLAAALSELQDALSETDDEVTGFGFEPIRSFSYNSLLGGSGTGSSYPKIETSYPKVEGSSVFKF